MTEFTYGHLKENMDIILNGFKSTYGSLGEVICERRVVEALECNLAFEFINSYLKSIKTSTTPRSTNEIKVGDIIDNTQWTYKVLYILDEKYDENIVVYIDYGDGDSNTDTVSEDYLNYIIKRGLR